MPDTLCKKIIPDVLHSDIWYCYKNITVTISDLQLAY